MTGVQVLHVAAEDADQRLDRWLRRLFPHLGQGRIEKMCRKGELRIDGGRVKASTRLEEGQSVRVPPLPDPGAISETKSPQSAKISDQDTAMNQGCAALRFGQDSNPRLVHRLDKDTSGVLLMARSAQIARALTAAFRHRTTRKIYWAALAGVPTPRMGTVKFGLGKAPGHG